jgi:hypothetical protein
MTLFCLVHYMVVVFANLGPVILQSIGTELGRLTSRMNLLFLIARLRFLRFSFRHLGIRLCLLIWVSLWPSISPA